MYLYFSEEELYNLLKNDIKNFSSDDSIESKSSSKSLPYYSYYMQNSMRKLPLNLAINTIAKAYDVYTYMYNNNSDFYEYYLEPRESTMMGELEYYYNNFINDEELSEENKRILKICNIEIKLGRETKYEFSL